jgi:hypothetical protein
MAKRESKPKKTGTAKKRARPQKPHKTIGILHSGTQGRHDENIAEFTTALRRYGYTNITIVGPLWSDDDPQMLADNARTLCKTAGLDLIIAAGGTASVYALVDAQSKTGNSTNVVFTSFSEQNAPAPNMTGVNAQTSGLDTARMDLLYQKAPATETEFGVLENQTRPNFDLSILQAWADSKYPRLIQLNRHSIYKNDGENDQAVINRINAAFDDWGQNTDVHFAQVCADPIFNDHRPIVTAAAKRNGITMIYQWKEFRDDGADPNDIVFGTRLIDAYTQAGTVAGQVLDAPQTISQFSVVTLTPQSF